MEPLAKAVNSFQSLSIFTKTFHLSCFNGLEISLWCETFCSLCVGILTNDVLKENNEGKSLSNVFCKIK